jgi:hypothetical protein
MIWCRDEFSRYLLWRRSGSHVILPSPQDLTIPLTRIWGIVGAVRGVQKAAKSCAKSCPKGDASAPEGLVLPIRAYPSLSAAFNHSPRQNQMHVGASLLQSVRILEAV